MGLESASVDLLSEVFGLGTIKMALMCCMFNCLISFLRMISSSRMKFCMMCNLLLRFNKLQPAGCNRVSPACSVLLYTMCIVLSVMIFLCMIIISCANLQKTQLHMSALNKQNSRPVSKRSREIQERGAPAI